MTSSEAYEVISLSSDESDEEDELSTKSYTVTSSKLKVVFGVEYRAPE